MYQASIGAHNHRSHRDDDYRLPAPVRPITDYFRQAGYYLRLEIQFSSEGRKAFQEV